jgi:hypothetical protein
VSVIITISVYYLTCAISVGYIVRLLEFKVMNEGSNPVTEFFTSTMLPTSPGSGSMIAGKVYV